MRRLLNTGSDKKTLPLFIFSAGFGFILNSLIVWGGMKLGFSYLVSTLPAIITVPVVSYFLQRYIVFKKV